MDEIERNMRPDPKKMAAKPPPKKLERKDEVLLLRIQNLSFLTFPFPLHLTSPRQYYSCKATLIKVA